MKSKLILGTVQLGLAYGINNQQGKPSKEQAVGILQEAAEQGISSLDTAAAYGDSEQIIGAYHAGKAQTPFQIITKFHNEGKPVNEVVSSALDRLAVKKIDTLLFHSYADYLKCRDQAVYQDLLNERGKTIDNLGVSVYTNDELETLANDDTVTVLQLPFNLLDNDSHRGKLLKSLVSAGKIIHTRSAFLQGLFFKKANQLPEKLKPLQPYLRFLNKLTESTGVPLGALALQYSLSKDYISGVLFGVETIDQLRLNMYWLSIHIDPELFDEVDKIEVKEKELLQPTNW